MLAISVFHPLNFQLAVPNYCMVKLQLVKSVRLKKEMVKTRFKAKNWVKDQKYFLSQVATSSSSFDTDHDGKK